MSTHSSTLPPPVADKRCTDLNACNWAMLAHLLAVPGLWFVGGALIGPILVWAFRRDLHSFVQRSAVHAFNFQFMVSLALLIAYLIAKLPLLHTVGDLAYWAIAVADAYFTIRAAWQARSGYSFDYPVSIPFLR